MFRQKGGKKKEEVESRKQKKKKETFNSTNKHKTTKKAETEIDDTDIQYIKQKKINLSIQQLFNQTNALFRSSSLLIVLSIWLRFEFLHFLQHNTRTLTNTQNNKGTMPPRQ